MTFTIQWKDKGVFITFRGIVKSQDLIDANNYLLSNADFDSLDYQVIDFSDVEDFKATSYDMGILGSMNSSQSLFNKKIKVAFITSDDYIKEQIKEYNKYMINTDWEIHTFNNLKEAKNRFKFDE
ncbi:MAG: hypothetical protein PWP52_10 [Bacteroidales bacterium]|jgi:hypothetical protein|nr:hypothetical protein [Bacteroidales bacterium]